MASVFPSQLRVLLRFSQNEALEIVDLFGEKMSLKFNPSHVS
jgi:hypothetical protein